MKTGDGNEIRQLVVQVVRGDLPLQALQRIGISVRFDDREFGLATYVDDPKKVSWGIEVTHSDLVLGLLRYRRDMMLLERWGRFVVASEIDFDDTLPNHQLVMDAVWDAAFAKYGTEINAETWARLRQIADDER